MAALRASINDERQIQVKFITKQDKYALPDTTFSISSSIKSPSLSGLINDLLRESQGETWTDVEFDFLINGELLRTSLNEHLKAKDVTIEVTVDVEYLERFPSPEPEDSLNHDDWVSAVHCQNGWILTGCYDNTVQIWKTDGTHKLTIPGHCGPVKGVQWIEMNETDATFISVSHDQTIMFWRIGLAKCEIDCVNIGRGHERSIECVDKDRQSTFLATGGWDNNVKIWAAVPDVKSTDSDNKSTNTRTPLMTLPGHKEAISSLVWTENNEIYSSSWDHTIKLWDAELGGLKSEIVGNKSFFDIDRSLRDINAIVAASADRHVRLYDTRSQEGSVVKATFTSHTGWVSSVCWSPNHDHLFISGGHDGFMKLWDTRSPKAPLYDMSGHDGKILCAQWSGSLVVSGATDNTLKIFSTSQDMMKKI